MAWEKNEDDENTIKIWRSWDRRVRLFSKLSTKIIATKTLSKSEAKQLVKLFLLYTDKFSYPEKPRAIHKKKLETLIRKTYG